MTHHAYISVAPGTQVAQGGRIHVLDKAIDHNTVLARDAGTGEWRHLRVAGLAVPNGDAQPPAPGIVENGPAYAAASRRLKAIQAVLALETRTEAEIARIGSEHGTSRSALYGWLKRYEDAPQISSLIAARPGQGRQDARSQARSRDQRGDHGDATDEASPSSVGDGHRGE